MKKKNEVHGTSLAVQSLAEQCCKKKKKKVTRFSVTRVDGPMGLMKLGS